MIINTHLLISNILYNHCNKKLNFKLNRLAFLYGNINPDFNQDDIKCPHTLDESIYHVVEYSRKLIDNNGSIKDFSVSLGTICHYICDYFCLYHSEKYKNRSIFKHLLYEIHLHVKFLMLCIRGKIQLGNNENLLQEDILSRILESYEKYKLEENSCIKDITYALSTVTLVFDSIIYLSNIKLNEDSINSLEEYELSEVKEGVS